jgi:hypothetical protein
VDVVIREHDAAEEAARADAQSAQAEEAGLEAEAAASRSAANGTNRAADRPAEPVAVITRPNCE